MRNRIYNFLLKNYQSSVKQVPIRGCAPLLRVNPVPTFLPVNNSFLSSSHVMVCRHFNSNSRDDRIIPELMEFPHVTLPNISHALRNKFLAMTLIRPYFDKEFRLKEFSQGAKFAAVQISQSLSCGDLDELEGLCTPECINTVSKNLSLFTMKQRSELNLEKDDMYFSFPYQIGIMMDDEPDSNGNYGRQVECTWVAHAFKNYVEILEDFNGNPMKVKEHMDEVGGPTILNFRFIRDFTKNVEDSWTVNAMNYFKIVEV